ncbi:ubiquitin hydrolase CA [Trypanosoma cruzi]|nr:ubiquitin hydrolase CA [Trypanosoma cruzi]
MNDPNDKFMAPRIGIEERTGGSCTSTDVSSPGTIPPSTSLESGQDMETALWPVEQQGGNNNSVIFDVGNSVEAGLAQEAVANVSLPSSGLINEGCTCYLNSLLQLLFHLGYFRAAVYRMPEEGEEEDGSCSISEALKELFFHMQERTTPGHTKKLTAAFGWTERELFIQHDIQEMATLLRDNLEEKMKGTVTEGAINQLFEGRGEQVVMTLDKTYVSRSRDIFYDIHLPLSPHVTLIESLRSLTVKEQLVGDNKYRVEELGKEPEYKDAEKSYEFCRFPPVIWFHLKRFEMNLMSPSLEMKKVNNRLEFPVELCLQEFEKGGENCEVGKRQNEEPKESNGNHAEEMTEKQKQQQQQQLQQQQPFSTNSPAIYDLQGVIVHRGSVRSGHYYCYIRQWDPVQESFLRWIEYDDDKVTVVSEDLAVSNNFGGCVTRQGRQSSVMATNNAYILSYVRRADCAKVLASPAADSIPQRVWNAYQREVLEDNRRLQMENEQRRKMNLVIFTDELIREHVEQFQSETFPRDIRASAKLGIELGIEKRDPVRLVYEVIAAHKQLRALQLNPGEFRLWRSIANRSIRPNLPLKTYEACGDTLMAEYLDKGEELNSPMTSIFVYLQLPTILPPFPVTDATSFILQSQKSEGVNEIACSILLRQSVKLDSVNLCLEYGCYRRSQFFVYLELRSEEGFLLEYKDRGYTNERTLFNFKVNPELQNILGLVYRIEMPKAAASVRVREIRLSAPATALPTLQPTYHPGEAVLPEANEENVLIFFKYFNYITCRLIYAGSAIVPLTATIEACGNVLRQLLDEDGATTEPIQMLEEKHATVRPLRNDETIASARITSAAVLIGQREETPLVCRYPRVEEYLNAILHAVLVRIVHIKFEKNTTPHLWMFDSSGTSINGGSVISTSSNGSSSSNINFNTTGRSGSAGGGGGGGGDNNSNSSGVLVGSDREGGVVGDSSVVEFVLCTKDEEKECCDTSFYASRRFDVNEIYMRSMNTQWSYAEVCEVIGAASGFDPNYIRLYRGDANVREQVSPEADPSPSTMSFGELLGGGRNCVLFFEVLPKPRRAIEAMPRVIVTVRTETNEPLYTEKIVMRQNASFGDLVRGTLERCSRMLRRRIPTTAAAAAAKDGNSSRINKSSDGCDINSANMGDGVAVPFRIASHYVVVVVDVGVGTIRKIIEAPMTPDGKCNCGLPIKAEREPLTLSLLPARPLMENEFRLACCHGDWPGDMYGCQPFIFGQPFFVTINNATTVSGAREVLLEYSGVPPGEVASSRYGVVMYTDIVRHFPNWNERLYLYWKNTENSSGRIPTLLLNHKRPREKPGSRYVVQNNPALRISKK